MSDVLVFAITRDDVANYVSTLALVYVILIFIRILMSWVPRIPYNRWLRAFLDFVTEVTDPYLNLFRRFIPMVGPLDLSPIVATVVLGVVAGIVTGLIRG